MTLNFWKKDKFTLLPIVCLLIAINAMAQNPCARKEAIVVSGNARFTVLTPEMIRIEYSDKGIFEDRATFAVQNRTMDTVPAFSTSEDSDYLYITTDKLSLKYRKETNPQTQTGSDKNLTITMNHNGNP